MDSALLSSVVAVTVSIIAATIAVVRASRDAAKAAADLALRRSKLEAAIVDKSDIYATFHDPTKGVSWVGAISGVITQFIGATFMVMYKSTTEQSADYVRILERINAVGMSVQLLEDIPKEDPLRTTTKAEMAKLLLEGTIYRRSPKGPPPRSEFSQNKKKSPARRRTRPDNGE